MTAELQSQRRSELKSLIPVEEVPPGALLLKAEDSPKLAARSLSKDYLAFGNSSSSSQVLCAVGRPGTTAGSPTTTASLSSLTTSDQREGLLGSPIKTPRPPTRLFVSSRFPAKYRRMMLLGQGGCGAVWLVERTSDGVHAAAKIVKLDGRLNEARAIDEPSIMYRFNSPFVVRYVDHWTDRKTAVVTVMELVDGLDLGTHMHNMACEIAFHMQQVRRLERGLPETSLSQNKNAPADAPIANEGSSLQFLSDDQVSRLSKKSEAIRDHLRAAKRLGFTETDATLLFVQMLLGIQHVHSRGIVHRDLKAGNIFLESTGLLKIGDFGLSGLIDTAEVGSDTAASSNPSKQSTPASASDPFLAKVAVGTPCYMAPELWCTEGMPPYSEKSDMWALGVILFELLAARRPFPREEPGVAIMAHIKAPLLQYAPNTSSEMVDLVNALLAPKPTDRPTASQALQFPVMRRAAEALGMFVRRASGKLRSDLAIRICDALTTSSCMMMQL